METKDHRFLRELYISTRLLEMAMLGWPQDRVELFLIQQFEAQHAHYLQHYPGARLDLIVTRESQEKIGRLHLHESETAFHLIEISLLPGWRAQQIGGQLIQDVLELAGARGKEVQLRVEIHNPALRLYQRLGFRQVGSDGVHHLMACAATPASALKARRQRTTDRSQLLIPPSPTP